MTIDDEINDLEKELRLLKEEYKVLDKFFKKGMDGNKFRELMAQKNEIEKFIAEIEVELELANAQKNNQ
jgi:hypothetical protein